MSKRKKIVIVILSIGIVCEAFTLWWGSLPEPWPAYRPQSRCSRVEFDSECIVGEIVDYFADPKHLSIKPGDLDGFIATNPWTFFHCDHDETFYVYVYDLFELCPVEYQDMHSGWDSSIYTFVMQY